ncbi:MAG: hypothetical protein JW983_07010 [Elusimicrobia bacterium]|nr:hypothetical protein [Elusimicrobiota bacterium]
MKILNIKNKCRICGSIFNPDKRHPYQKVCFREKCRRLRNLNLERKWRKRNPSYFKGEWRREYLSEKLKKWRRENPTYFKTYLSKHPELKKKHNQYMRMYRSLKKRD